MARRTSDIAFFVALLSTALALGAALAHALELPNKFALGRESYFTVQQIYRGWNLLGFLLVVELPSMIAATWTEKRRPEVVRLVLGAIACLLLAQVLFWTFTFPANKATANWTIQPDDWELLRRQWEFSHAAGAAFQVLAMSLTIVAALRRR